MIAPNHPIQLALGLVIWSAWFVAAYGGLSVGCRIAPPAPEAGSFTWINLALLAITVPVIAGLLVLARRCWRFADSGQGQGQGFVASVAAGIHLTAAAATLGIALPALYLPPCL